MDQHGRKLENYTNTRETRKLYVGTQSRFQINSTLKLGTKSLTNNMVLGNMKTKNAKRGGEKLRIQEPLSS